MIYCFLADGFEEIEAIAPIDILRRTGVEVQTVGVFSDIAQSSHGVSVTTDLTLDALKIGDNISGVILPGGMPGTKHLDHSDKVKAAVSYCLEHKLPVAAICAAPSVLGHMGALDGRRATCFPGFEKELAGAEYTGDKVTVDGNIITARGAGCALEFGRAIAAYLVSEDAADATLAQMQV